MGRTGSWGHPVIGSRILTPPTPPTATPNSPFFPQGCSSRESTSMETFDNCEGTEDLEESSALTVIYFLLTSVIFLLIPVHHLPLPPLPLLTPLSILFGILTHRDLASSRKPRSCVCKVAQTLPAPHGPHHHLLSSALASGHDDLEWPCRRAGVGWALLC